VRIRAPRPKSRLLSRAHRGIKRLVRHDKRAHGGIDMNTEESKKIVLGFFENLNAGNAAAALDALGDSATWWIQGNFPLSGTRNKAQFVELLGQLGAAIDGALSLRVKGVTAEGDRVAVEAESFAKMKTGKTYQNRYHFLCEVRGGKIQAVREYLDTMHANEVLC
jgi:ketosteroid isomerase-like protein